MTRNEIRDKVQNNVAAHIRQVLKTIVLVSVRVGKTRAALKAVDAGEKILVIYPLVDIKTSWTKELEVFTPASDDITFCTTRSLKKYMNTTWDYIIIDEPQMLSINQIEKLKTIKGRKIVGLTGTLNKENQKLLKEELNLSIGFTYTLKDAIEDKLVKDYRIFIHFVGLNKEKKCPYMKSGRNLEGTEEEIYAVYTERMQHFEEAAAKAAEEEDKQQIIFAKSGYNKYMRLRTDFLYNSESLFSHANHLVQQYKDEKVLIYTLRTDIADRLSSVSYHSKNKEEDVLTLFKTAATGHCATVNCVQAGVTIENLNKVIFHAYESNTEVLHQKLARSLLWQFEGEMSEVHIVCLKDTQMETWVEQGCRSLDQYKIFYVFRNRTLSKLDYIKKKNPDKKLYIYDGTIVYFSRIEGFGVSARKMYKFLGNETREYPLPQNKLEQI